MKKINVLVVEDDLNKGREILTFLRDNLPLCEFSRAHSYQSGLKRILSDHPDFIILDMTMPTFDVSSGDKGGRPRPFAGREILREMKRSGVKIPTVIVTQFETFGEASERMTLDELKEQLEQHYPDLYVGTIYYHPAQSDWREKLKVLVIQEFAKRGMKGAN